jgi:oxalate decarboxylase/phosphoglucose isomerase-like protein (cupin superfamily)
MDMIHLPRGVAIKPYVREVEDVYFVLEGAITVGWEKDGEIVERRLGERDLMFNPAGRAHYFRNDGAADAQFTMVMGSPKPQPVAFDAAGRSASASRGRGLPWSLCTASARRRARSIG